MNIAILTRLPSYFSEQRLSEEAKKRGHDVALVPYPKCSISLDPGKTGVYYEGGALDALDVIVPRLSAGSVSYGAAIARQLEVMGVYTTASSIAITRAFDYIRALQVMQRSGVVIPKTVFMREAEQWSGPLSDFNLPVIVRPATATRGGGPVVAETSKAATALMDAFSKSAISFMVQERVGEEPVDVAALVVGSRVVASVQRTDTQYTAAKLTDEENKIVLKAAKAIGLTVCGVQLTRTAKGAYVTGVEATPSLETYEKATQRNVAEKIIDYIELNAKRRNKKDRVGA
jgi:ribosomal protein S6--L-glutamate ligase